MKTLKKLALLFLSSAIIMVICLSTFRLLEKIKTENNDTYSITNNAAEVTLK